MFFAARLYQEPGSGPAPGEMAAVEVLVSSDDEAHVPVQQETQGESCWARRMLPKALGVSPPPASPPPPPPPLPIDIDLLAFACSFFSS